MLRLKQVNFKAHSFDLKDLLFFSVLYAINKSLRLHLEGRC